MRFGTDPDQVEEIQWYICQPGALDLGFPTPFASRDNDRWEIWPEIGEVQFAQRLNTPNVGLSPAPGTHAPCGDPNVWANGYPGHVPPDYPRNAFGVLLCCASPMGCGTLGFEILAEVMEGGGLDFGGLRDVWGQLPALGGFALGGKADQFGWQPAREGLSFGGLGDAMYWLDGMGGLAFGGLADLTGPLPSHGGFDLGGKADAWGQVPAVGGLDFGGRVDRIGWLPALGGFTLGGLADLTGQLPATGGIDLGGPVDQQSTNLGQHYYVSVCCTGDITATTLLTGTNLVWTPSLSAWAYQFGDWTFTLTQTWSGSSWNWILTFETDDLLSSAGYYLNDWSGLGSAAFNLAGQVGVPIFGLPAPGVVFVQTTPYAAICEVPNFPGGLAFGGNTDLVGWLPQPGAGGLALGGKADAWGQTPALGGIALGGSVDVVTAIPSCTQAIAHTPPVSGSGTGTTATANFGYTTTAGNTIAICITNHGTNADAPSVALYTELENQGTGLQNPKIGVWYRYNAPATSSLTWSVNSPLAAAYDWVMFEFSPGGLAGTVDQVNVNSGSGTAASVATLNPTTSKCEIAIAHYGTIVGDTISSSAAGWTVVSQGTSCSMYKILSATGSQSSTATISLGVNWYAVIGTLK